MSYDFSFEKKSVILIVIGCVVIGAVLFFAGFIVSVDRGQNQTIVQASSSMQNESKSEDKKQPRVPLIGKPAASEKPAAETSEKPASEKSKEPLTAEKSKESAAAAEAKPPATPDSAAKEDDAKDKEKPAFSLQLGAFQTENNAVKLSDTFKSKGYPVFLFRVMDADGHVWHTVRMGHYADMKEATQAAAKMTSKEQISVWVRPSNAF